MTIVQSLERACKGQAIKDTVVPLGGGCFRVQATDGKSWYLVNLGEQTCSCPDNKYRGNLCKHLHAVFQALQPAKIRVQADATGTVTGWHYSDQADADRQARIERGRKAADELFPA